MVANLVVKSDAVVVGQDGWGDGGMGDGCPMRPLAIDERGAARVGIYGGIGFFHPCKDSVRVEGDTVVCEIENGFLSVIVAEPILGTHPARDHSQSFACR